MGCSFHNKQVLTPIGGSNVYLHCKFYRASLTALVILTYREDDDSGRRSHGHGTFWNYGVRWWHRMVAMLVAQG